LLYHAEIPPASEQSQASHHTKTPKQNTQVPPVQKSAQVAPVYFFAAILQPAAFFYRIDIGRMLKPSSACAFI